MCRLEVTLEEFIESDQSTKVRLSELVSRLKGVSSRLLKRESSTIATFRSVRKSAGALWSPSYFIYWRHSDRAAAAVRRRKDTL